MLIHKGSIPILEEPTAIIPGIFDGLHLGHQKLIKRGVSSCKKNGLSPCIFTFTPHPMSSSYILIDGNRPEATFNIECFSGTYIRTLFFDIGEAIGTGASLSFLRRTGIGDFKIEKAISLEDFKKETKREKFIIPIDSALYFMDEAIVSSCERIMEGGSMRFEGGEGFVKIITRDGIFVGIGKNERGILRPIKIIATRDDLL